MFENPSPGRTLPNNPPDTPPPAKTSSDSLVWNMALTTPLVIVGMLVKLIAAGPDVVTGGVESLPPPLEQALISATQNVVMRICRSVFTGSPSLGGTHLLETDSADRPIFALTQRYIKSIVPPRPHFFENCVTIELSLPSDWVKEICI